ncbi:acetyl-CoA C-acetyltransferase, partial [Yersinia sp. 2542 StPb PI]|uniref:acetyl-CoA C-acetyltransferase n=1 Tax=Yersinia sp. 2542 StPb PI TaxID=3117408 RepID=UPI003B286853
VEDIVIVGAKRTAIGSFQGGLSTVPATELGTTVIKDLLCTYKIKAEDIDQVIMGQVLTAGCGQNPARQAALNAGLPNDVCALTINKVCGSGLIAIQLAAQAIRNGDAEIIIAGGQENMSLSPHILLSSRQGTRVGNSNIVDSMVNDGLTDAYKGYHMGITAENVASQYNISREDQDTYSILSHRKALTAIEEGKFKAEISPVIVMHKKGSQVIDTDEGPRVTEPGRLAKLKPAFDSQGTVTAGNASSLNDGAAAVIVCSASKAKELGLIPLVKISAFANTGICPSIMGVAPIAAITQCLDKINKDISQIDLFECNEAFAAQSLAIKRALAIPKEKININGGAIALGHPIGASGCRILVSLIYQLSARNLKNGIAALCVGGGEGLAMAVTRL